MRLRAPQAAAPRPAPALLARGLAGPVKVHEVSQEDYFGPSEVARTEAKIEMGVRYEAGVPSPMEGAYHNEPIVVDGLVAKTGGDGLGCPVQYIKLSAWCARAREQAARARRAALAHARASRRGLTHRCHAPQGPYPRRVQVLGHALRLKEGARLRGEAGQVADAAAALFTRRRSACPPRSLSALASPVCAVPQLALGCGQGNRVSAFAVARVPATACPPLPRGGWLLLYARSHLRGLSVAILGARCHAQMCARLACV